MEIKLETITIHSREDSNKYVRTVLGGELAITFVEQNADDALSNPRFRAIITFERNGSGELFDGSDRLHSYSFCGFDGATLSMSTDSDRSTIKRSCLVCDHNPGSEARKSGLSYPCVTR